jgi:hypothetical protein
MSVAGYDVITAIGPGSDLLPNNMLNGYTPVSRNGEQTQNAFIDTTIWNETISDGLRQVNANTGVEAEQAPPFESWASVQPGQICVHAKNRAHAHQRYANAEMSVPVLACAQKWSYRQNRLFRFAGVARSKSIRTHDDVANGMTKDEHFTLAIGGMVTILNNGNAEIKIGDPVEWTFQDTRDLRTGIRKGRGVKVGPRMIQVRKGRPGSANVFGTAKSYAGRGEWFDVLIGNGAM